MSDTGGNTPHDLSQRTAVPTSQHQALQAPPAHSRTPVSFNDQGRTRPLLRAVPPQTSPRASGASQSHVVRSVTALPLNQTGPRPRVQTPSMVGGQWVLASPSAVMNFNTHATAAFLPGTQTASSQVDVSFGTKQLQSNQSRPLAGSVPSRSTIGTPIRLPAGVAVGSRVTIPANRQGTSLTITTTNAAVAASRQSPLPEAKLVRAIPAQIRPSPANAVRPHATVSQAPNSTNITSSFLTLSPSMVTIRAVGNQSSMMTTSKPVLSAVRVIPGPVVPQVAPPSVTAAFIRSGLQTSSASYTTSPIATVRSKTVPTTPLLGSALTFEKPRSMKCDMTSQAIDLTTGGSASHLAQISMTPISVPLKQSLTASETATAVEPPLTVQSNNQSHPSSLAMTVDSPLTPNKVGASPRPSILRKRDLENGGSPLKAMRNLTSVFGTVLSGIHPLNITSVAEQNFVEDTIEVSVSSVMDTDAPSDLDLSPRKKPRKQLLQVQEIESDDFEETVEQSEPTTVGEMEIETSDEVSPYVKLPRMSLLESFKPSWKPCLNHFLRHGDVKVKDEKRPTVTDLANQKQVLQTIRGWNVYRVESQLTDISDMEAQAGERFRAILQSIETQGRTKDADRAIELLKGNLQRCKVIHDQILDSKSQILKIFDHKKVIEEVIQRYNFESGIKQEKEKKKK